MAVSDRRSGSGTLAVCVESHFYTRGTEMRSTSGMYAVGFDHVRAFAAILVFMWHFSHPPFGAVPFGFVPDFFALSIFNEGHTGVALFMTLSGFIFSYLSFGKDIHLGQFYKNRFLRVFPLFFVWCIYGVAVQGYPVSQVAASVLTLLDKQIPAGGWTVVVEAQFYLLFPFIHPIIEAKYRKHGLLGVGAYVGALLALSWSIRTGTWIAMHSTQMLAYWTIFGRIDQFLLGAFSFYVYKSIVSKWSAGKSAIALSVLVAVFLMFWRWFNLRGGYFVYGGSPSIARVWIAMPSIEGAFYGAAIALYLQVSRGFSGRIAKAFAYIGTISYSIYLANFFVIPVLIKAHAVFPFRAETTFGEYFVWGVLIGLPVICIFSAATFELIERPFLERRKRYTSTSKSLAHEEAVQPAMISRS
jgi:peptidoglycan/LPS O-acetylase OafA/YrhL